MQAHTCTYINAIGTAVPQHKVLQSDAAKYMANTLAHEPDMSRKINILYRATRITERYSVLEDFSSEEGTGFFSQNGKKTKGEKEGGKNSNGAIHGFPGTAARMRRYREEACPLGVAAVKDALPDEDLSQITHLITVSCTGMYAPGLDIDLVKALGLSLSIERTCINFMGCYAAFNALKAADVIVKAKPDSKVLIVSVELCTLHFQRDTDKDQLLANSLFADGAAAVLVSAQQRKGWNLSLEAFRCQLIPEGEGDMAWTIIDHGFKMVLSAYVPELLAGAADETLAALMNGLPVSPDSISHYALHPGGRRVLEGLERAMNLPKEVNSAAYHVLNKYGNMSSATVLFVLKEKLKALTATDHGSYLLSMAFGPGLTLEAGVMQLNYQA